MDFYTYDTDTGIYKGKVTYTGGDTQNTLRYIPLPNGERIDIGLPPFEPNYPNSTRTPPPEATENTLVVFRDGEWVLVAYL